MSAVSMTAPIVVSLISLEWVIKFLIVYQTPRRAAHG
jgi:hypothetical protein